MTCDRFENLPAWKSALELGPGVFALTDDRAFSAAGGLRDQIRRAAVSVSNNTAEGFERGSTAELLAFLYIARGSAGEVRSMLRLLDRWASASHLQCQVVDLISLAESCSRQIRGWAESLQNSEIKGPRHLNDRTRAANQDRKRADEFRSYLAAIQEQAAADWMEKMEQAKSQPPSGPGG